VFRDVRDQFLGGGVQRLRHLQYADDQRSDDQRSVPVQ
jgi:hypothetical protein